MFGVGDRMRGLTPHIPPAITSAVLNECIQLTVYQRNHLSITSLVNSEIDHIITHFFQ